MKRNYKETKKEISLNHNIPQSEIEIIDKVQFEFLREKMKDLKNVRLPNFGIFVVAKSKKDG